MSLLEFYLLGIGLNWISEVVSFFITTSRIAKIMDEYQIRTKREYDDTPEGTLLNNFREFRNDNLFLNKPYLKYVSGLIYLFVPMYVCILNTFYLVQCFKYPGIKGILLGIISYNNNRIIPCMEYSDLDDLKSMVYESLDVISETKMN